MKNLIVRFVGLFVGLFSGFPDRTTTPPRPPKPKVPHVKQLRDGTVADVEFISALWNSLRSLKDKHPTLYEGVVSTARGTGKFYRINEILRNNYKFISGDYRDDYPLCPSIVALVKLCVEGDGVNMVLHSPWLDESGPLPPSEPPAPVIEVVDQSFSE